VDAFGVQGVGLSCSWLIIGLLAGALASAFTGRRGMGCLGNIIVGLVGAFVGGLLVSVVTGAQFDYQNVGFCTSVLVSAGGAAVLIVALRLITGNGGRRI
jgi:uncharacterized membrane protein YeaQ/YmgE (transglycosylase-associated protein family)